MPKKEPTHLARAYRVKLDLNAEQEQRLLRHAGANRVAYNFTLARLLDAHSRQLAAVAAAATSTPTFAHLDPEDARAEAWKLAAVKGLFPTRFALEKEFRGDHSWLAEIETYAWTSGIAAAFASWKLWRIDKVNDCPRFKRRHTSRVSFTLFHDVKAPTLRLLDLNQETPGRKLKRTRTQKAELPSRTSHRRFRLPAKISGESGSVRTHGSLRKLARRLASGAEEVSQVTLKQERNGSWWMSVLARRPLASPPPPTRRQVTAGAVGVDLGVKTLATASDGTTWDNPRHSRNLTTKRQAAARKLSRAMWHVCDREGNPTGQLVDNREKRQLQRRGVRVKPTAGRLAARREVNRVSRILTERRDSTTHLLTKQLCTSYAHIGLEDLNVAGMTASAKGTVEKPGRNVRAKAGLNREILDVRFGEIRRQMLYKSALYGSHVTLVDRWEPTSKTCSVCKAVKPKLSLAERTYQCENCGNQMDRDLNAARNILAAAVQNATPTGNGSHETPMDEQSQYRAAQEKSEGLAPPGVEATADKRLSARPQRVA